MRLVVHRATGGSYSLGISSWSEKYRLEAPWESLEATLAEPILPSLRPRARDWVLLQPGPGRTVFIGKVAKADWRINSSEVGEALATSISLVGIWDSGRRINVVASPAITQQQSTLYPIIPWVENVVQPLVAQVGKGEIGTAISAFVRALYQIKVPAAIAEGGVRFGEIAQVAWNPSTASALGLGNLEPVQGFTINGIRSNLKTSARALEILLGTFSAKPLVELFPRMVPKPKGYKGPAIAGLIPTLVYRMAPWRDKPLAALSRSYAPGVSLPGIQQPAAQFTIGGAGPYNPSYFEAITWDPTNALVLTPATISGDADHENDYTAATGWFSEFRGGDDIKFVSSLGLPIIDPERLDRDGVSIFELNWPFMPPLSLLADVSVFELGQKLAMTGMQFFGNSGAYESGRATLQYLDRRVIPGIPVKLQLGSQTLTAYVDEVIHSVQTVAGNAEVGETTIQFSRGTWPGQDRSPAAIEVRTVTVESEPAPTTPTEVNDNACAMGRGTTFPESIFDVRLNRCPQSLRRWALRRLHSRANSLARTFLANEWQNSNFSETERRMVIQCAAAYVIEKYWRQVDPQATVGIEDLVRTGSDDASHRFGAAIDFWIDIPTMINKRNGDRLNPVTLAVLDGGPGRVQNKVPVFQAWGTVRELARQDRIPAGGRGLYLNVTATGPANILGNSAGNEDPTDPRFAGRASGDGTTRPPGSAGEVHWDHRGALGLTRWNDKERPPTSWLHLDLKGDGIDVIVQAPEYGAWPLVDGKLPMDGPNPLVPPGVRAEQRKRHLSFEAARKCLEARAAAYVLSGGLGDPWLPDVGPTVPNILQVVGHEPSCFTLEISE